MMQWVLGAWLAWCGLQLAAMLTSPLWYRPRGNAYTNGVFIWICPTLAARLSQLEVAAVWLHECGHRRYAHNWRNLARNCLFLRLTDELELERELEADEYVHAHGLGLALASALLKINPVGRRDRYRVRRLELLHAFAPTSAIAIPEH